MRPYTPDDHIDESDEKDFASASMESDIRLLVAKMEFKKDLNMSLTSTPGYIRKRKKYESLVIVMSHEEFHQVEEEYA